MLLKQMLLLLGGKCKKFPLSTVFVFGDDWYEDLNFFKDRLKASKKKNDNFFSKLYPSQITIAKIIPISKLIVLILKYLILD